jgi:hypothetical protein
VLLDALPVEDVNIGARHGRGAEELFRESCLADAGFARDEDELTLALAGPAKTLMELLQLSLPPDERRTGLDAAGRGGPRLDISAGRRPFPLAAEIADLGHEPKATPMDSLDESWRSRSVSQSPAQLADRFRERVIGNGGVGPDLAVEGLLGDEETGSVEEIAEHIPRLGPQRNLTFSPPQPVAGDIHAKSVEDELATRRQRC